MHSNVFLLECIFRKHCIVVKSLVKYLEETLRFNNFTNGLDQSFFVNSLCFI